jgi:pimeloyl-ACP methyl ester carboxylesterase
MHPLIVKGTGTWLNMLAAVSPQRAGKKGFELFCRPLRGKLKQHHHNFFNSAQRFTVDFNGLPIQCYQWGSGTKTVLFLHGWQSHSFRWKAYIDAFAKDGFTVYAMDAPGHGLSGGSQLNLILYSQLLQYFLFREASIDCIVAHSFGGYAGIYALYCNPALPVNKMVLMGTPGKVTDFFELYSATLGLKQPALKAIEKHFVHTIGNAPAYFDTAKLTKNFCKPAMIVHDTDDADAPYEHAAAMYANWRNAQLLTTSGLGHNLKSAEIMRQVMQFANETATVRSVTQAAGNTALQVH